MLNAEWCSSRPSFRHLAFSIRALTARYEFSSRQMGTEARIVLFAASDAAARGAADQAFARIAALDAVMSDYRDDSELMALCRQAGTGPVHISDDLFRVLDASQRLARESGGAFDVTAAPLIHLWRRARRVAQFPDPADIAAAKALTGTAALILDAHHRTADLRQASHAAGSGRHRQGIRGGRGRGPVETPGPCERAGRARRRHRRRGGATRDSRVDDRRGHACRRRIAAAADRAA